MRERNSMRERSELHEREIERNSMRERSELHERERNSMRERGTPRERGELQERGELHEGERLATWNVQSVCVIPFCRNFDRRCGVIAAMVRGTSISMFSELTGNTYAHASTAVILMVR